MKTYDKNVKLKLKTFLKKNLKQKINLILVLLGIKFLIDKTLYLFLSFFIKNRMPFLKRVIFDINKEKAKYIFSENKEKFLLLTNDQVISKECFTKGDYDYEKFQKVINFFEKRLPNY